MAPDNLFAFTTDSPIASQSEDLLKREGVADGIVARIRETPADRGYVIGLMGPWGSGKTSILNLVRAAAQPDIRVVEFNPWLFSGTEQLVTEFFAQLIGVLGKDKNKTLQRVAKNLELYTPMITSLSGLPVVGSLFGAAGGAGSLANKLIRRRLDRSVSDQRREIEQGLRDAKTKVLILIDDIDRLRRAEVQDVMRLVRLVANFPNCIYLLAFDRLRVEASLQEIGNDGRAYLEKILQVSVRVPEVRQPDLFQQLLAGINATLEGKAHGPYDQQRLENLLALVVLPLIHTVRDVRRYANALAVTISIIGEEVDLGDLLAIEAFRVLQPDIFDGLVRCRDILTSTRDRNDTSHAARIAELVKSAED